MSGGKAKRGNFFEDFAVGQVLVHATPRTLTAGDVALYTGLYGPRFAVQSSDAFAKAVGYPRAPVDDLLVFHTVFGKTVPDISLNAVANLGYAECRFLKAVYPGDTLSATSEVIGLRENANKASGVVYVRTTGRNQDGATVLEYVRWVMVRKRDAASPAPAPVVPKTAERVDPATLGAAVPESAVAGYDFDLAGSASSLGRLRRRREDRPHRRHDAGRSRAPDRDAPLPEHRQGAFQSARAGAGPVQAAAGLRRRRHLARPRALLQRPRQRLPHRGHQRRAARRALLCAATPSTHGRRCWRPRRLPNRRDIGALRVRLAAVKNRALRGFPIAKCRRRIRRGRDPRSRSVARAAALTQPAPHWHTIHRCAAPCAVVVLLRQSGDCRP